MSHKSLLVVMNTDCLISEDGNMFLNRGIVSFFNELSELDITPSLLMLDSGKRVPRTDRQAGKVEISHRFQVFLLKTLKQVSWPLKIWNLIVALCKMVCCVATFEHIYIFFPGNISRLAVLVCRLMHKKYGLYVRGDRFSVTGNRTAFEHADFILTTGRKLESAIQQGCRSLKRIDEVVPMVSVFNHPDPYHRVCRSSETSVVRGLFVGRVERQKGCRELLQAIRRLKEENYKFLFHFVGSVDSDVAELIDGLELRDIVICKGAIADPSLIAAEYAKADFFCLPSYTEGFPRVIYEALYYSLPIITTMVGGIGGLMKDRENCLEVQVKDVESLTEALREMISHSDIRERYSCASRDLFVQLSKKFSGRSHAKQICTWLNEGKQ